MVLIPFSAFTYSRRGGNTMVAEHSDLACDGHVPRERLPLQFYVQGQRATVLYKATGQVHDASGEDVVATVYKPEHPLPRPNIPDLHVLND